MKKLKTAIIITSVITTLVTGCLFTTIFAVRQALKELDFKDLDFTLDG